MSEPTHGDKSGDANDTGLGGESSPFTATGDSPSSMFEVLEATEGDVLAVRVGTTTPKGQRELYELLAERSDEYGTVHVYEELPDWSLLTYLSSVSGRPYDLQYGSAFDIGRYAGVGDSPWTRLMFTQWRSIAPMYFVSPDEMRLYEPADRETALKWVRTGVGVE